MLMSLNGCAMYFLEELTDRTLETSNLKKITANEDVPGRGLYAGKSKSGVVCLGKLVVNANTAPKIGATDGATWDRCMMIPWDYHYVQPADFKLGCANTKVIDSAAWTHLTSLKQAWFTVCCRAFTEHCLQNRFTVDSAHVHLSPPECTLKLTNSLRSVSQPVIGFIEQYLLFERDSLKFPLISDVFYAFQGLQNCMNIPPRATQSEFQSMLEKHGVEVTYDIAKRETRVRGRSLSPTGLKLIDEWTTKRGIITADANVGLKRYFQEI